MNIALIGASNNKEKYGNKVLIDLISKGKNVIPVNPKESHIENIKCYPNIEKTPKKLDLIVFVVPPSVTLSILTKLKEKNIKTKIWCQPGASDEKVELFLKNNGFDSNEFGSCIMKST